MGVFERLRQCLNPFLKTWQQAQGARTSFVTFQSFVAFFVNLDTIFWVYIFPIIA